MTSLNTDTLIYCENKLSYNDWMSALEQSDQCFEDFEKNIPENIAKWLENKLIKLNNYYKTDNYFKIYKTLTLITRVIN